MVRRPHRARSGFTLLELMVALVAGLIAVVWIYALGSSSSRFFQEQQRVSQTQSSLRAAMEQLRADVARAGLFGTPNSSMEANQACTPNRTTLNPITAFQLFNIDPGVANNLIPNSAVNLAQSDVVRLVGNYATQAGYMITGVDGTGGRVFLQTNWQAFRRDFGVFNTATFDPIAFANAFQVGRVLHLQTLQGNHFFSPITAVSAANASVTIQPIGSGGLCVVGLADGATVAPLSRIEYRILSPAGNPALSALVNPDPVAAASEGVRGLTNSVLVRREIAFNNAGLTNPVVVPNSERIVLEYAVNLDFRVVLDQQLTPGSPPILQAFTGALAQTRVNSAPHRLRAVTITLAARTAEQDPRFDWVPPVAGQPMTRFQVNPVVAGAARVRSMRTEIVLPNVMNRVIRP